MGDDDASRRVRVAPDTFIATHARKKKFITFMGRSFVTAAAAVFSTPHTSPGGGGFFLAASPGCNFQGFLGGVKNVGVPLPFSPLYAVFFGGMGHSTCGHEREKKKSFSSPERSRSHLLFNIPFVFR